MRISGPAELGSYFEIQKRGGGGGREGEEKKGFKLSVAF